MKSPNTHFNSGPVKQRGVSLIVAMIMLLVLTLIGVGSMNTAIVELKMASSAQQQSRALNRADELLRVGENRVLDIVDDPAAFNYNTADDGYYLKADNIDVYDIDWAGQGLASIEGDTSDDVYVVEYMGAETIPGESQKIGTDGRIIGGAVHTHRITSRSATGKNALRLVQSIYVTDSPP
jgi:type IV pilus assembly protein PilX